MALTKITTSVIAANTLGTANIADNSIDATKIAANSILTRHIDDDQITGDQLADDITIAGNLTVSGNLVTNGSSVTNSSTNTTIEDNLIELGTGTTGAPSSDSGIVIERGDSDNAFIGWDESEDKFILGTGSFTGASTGNLTITTAPLVVGALTTSGLSFPTSDGTNGQVLKTDGSGSLTFGDNTTKVDNYTATGDGSTTAFDTGINPGSEVNTWIFIDGVYQQKSEYSYSGSTVTFTTAPQNGASIDVITGTSSNITASDTVLGVYEATTTNTDTYATGISASNENNTWVFVGGVYQPKDSYTFSSGTLTFDANTPTGQKLSVVATKTITAGAVDTSTLAANAVTSAKIASNSILSRHIANNSIVGADISATTQITASTFTGALTGDVTGNVVGNLTGTIQTAAQTNITSVGTLSALTVSGQLTAGGLSYPTSDGTNEQVLRTDGSGNLSFGTISGTTINNNTNNYVITGTGTANTLNGESGLTYDGTTLDVTGTVLATRAEFGGIETSADRPLMVKTDTDNFALHIEENSGAESWQIGVDADGDLGFHNSATASASVTFNDSGNVGIGTTNPTEDLTIASTSPQIRFEDTDASGTPYSKVSGVLGNIYIQADDGNEIADSKIDFRVDGTQRMIIDASGNVGIGQISPATTLHIGDGASHYVRIENAGSGDVSSGYQIYRGSSVGMMLYDNPADNATSLLAAGKFNIITGGSGIDFHIDSSGNVGIGTTSPSDFNSLGGKQVVIGNGTQTNNLTLYSSTTGGGVGYGHIAFADSNTSSSTAQYAGLIQYYHGDDSMALYTGSTKRMTIDSSGRVGINRIPAIGSSKLEVGGADNVPLINVEASGTTGGIGVGSSKVQIFHGTSAKLFLTSDGSLGINESVPTGKLHVRDNNFAGYMGVFSQGGTGGANHGMYIETASSSSYLMIQKVSGTTMHYVVGNGNYYFAGTAQSDLNKKENIADISSGLDVVNNLRPRTFNFKDNSTVDKAGFIAQEAQIVEPRLVSGSEFDETQTDENGSNPTGLGFDYMGYTAYLTKAIQEQQTIIDDLKSRIETLEE
jgi:hypothetical protein